MSENIEARIATLEADLGELRDREAIREVIHRYCQGADRCDLELFKSCYWPDGYDDHGFFAGNAHEFCEYVIPALAQVESSFHSITNTQIVLKGARASVSSQWSVIHRLRHERGFTDFLHNGRYLDVFEKREGGWKIFHRVIVGDADRWVETLDILSASLDDQNQPLQGARGSSDPGYLGFNLLKHKPDREAMSDLWGGFHQLAKATRNG